MRLLFTPMKTIMGRLRNRWQTMELTAHLTECWFVVEPWTAFSMATCTNFEVERTIYSEEKINNPIKKKNKKNLRMLGDLNLARLPHSLSLDYTDSSCLWDYGFILKQYGVIRKSFHDNQCYEKINTISLKIYAVRRRSLSIITINWTHHLYRADI